MANFRLLDPGRKFTDSNGDPASGYQLFVYDAGTTTKATSYKDSAGAATHTNPIVLESDGGLPNRELWVPTGSYKLVLASDTDTDPPSSGTTIGDNLDPINDVSENSASEWVASGLTPTYVDGDTFTVPGDQTNILHAGRRLQITDSGGTVYATISSSSYSSSTTVNLTVDGGDTIDSGISSFSYGLLSAAGTNPSLEQAVHKIASGTVSSAASLDITDLSTEYLMYEIVFSDLLPATDTVDLLFRTSTNNGSSFNSGASDYAYTSVRNTTTAALDGSYSGGSTAIAFNDNGGTPVRFGNTAGTEEAAGWIRITNPTNANEPTQVTAMLGSVNSGSIITYYSCFGQRLNAEDNDAVQILFSSGNIATMEYTVYGYLA